MIKFKINSYKSNKYFWVYIHEDLEDFKTEAKKYESKSGKYIWFGEFGLFHPYEKFRILKDKKELKFNDIGIIRLTKDKLYPRCVYHEVLHAALWQYRLKHKKKADFGSSIDKREEELA